MFETKIGDHGFLDFPTVTNYGTDNFKKTATILAIIDFEEIFLKTPDQILLGSKQLGKRQRITFEYFLNV